MNDSFFKKFFAMFGVLWVFSALLGLAASGLIVYILYRLATHPW